MSEIRSSKVLRPISVETTSEERTMAATAHASSLLTLLISFGTAGLGGILFAFVPFLIYLSYKDKSRFVAFHAAQAFALQVVGTVGFFLSIIAGTIVMVVVWAVSGLLVVILIGFILLILSLIITLAIITIWISAPFVGMAFSCVGAYETANGRNYYYPYIGEWVQDWLKRQEAEATPAV